MASNVGLLSLQLGAVGLGFLVIGIPLARKLVPPNSVYGFRVRRTLQDERAWYAVNAAFGKDLIAVGAAGMIAALVGWIVAGSHPGFPAAFVDTGVLVAGSLVAMIHGFAVLRRI